MISTVQQGAFKQHDTPVHAHTVVCLCHCLGFGGVISLSAASKWVGAITRILEGYSFL